MARKLFVVVFLLALFGSIPVLASDQATGLNPAPQALFPLLPAACTQAAAFSPALSPLVPTPAVAAACTAHVCNICAQSGLACTPIPYCHCE